MEDLYTTPKVIEKIVITCEYHNLPRIKQLVKNIFNNDPSITDVLFPKQELWFFILGDGDPRVFLLSGVPINTLLADNDMFREKLIYFRMAACI